LLGATEPQNNQGPVCLPKELPEARLLQALRPGNWTRWPVNGWEGLEPEARERRPNALAEVAPWSGEGEVRWEQEMFLGRKSGRPDKQNTQCSLGA
jgi:hypothetical protein